MDYIAELSAIAKENGGIIQTKLAAQHRFGNAMLCSELCLDDAAILFGNRAKFRNIVHAQHPSLR